MAPPADPPRQAGGKSADAFRTISEVAATLDVPQHVLRFWESKFSQVKPLKRGGGRRYYRPEDVELLQTIRGLLYDDGYTIKGVQKLFREGALKAKRRSPQPADAGAAKAAAAAPAVDAQAAATLSRAQRVALQNVLDELEQLKKMLEGALK